MVKFKNYDICFTTISTGVKTKILVDSMTVFFRPPSLVYLLLTFTSALMLSLASTAYPFIPSAEGVILGEFVPILAMCTSGVMMNHK
jgi:hypothetical protein